MTTPLRVKFPAGHELRRHKSAPPGEGVLLSAALAIGILLMAIQLWILTVALEQFKRHHYGEVIALAGVSASIFAGGVVMLWLLRRTPKVCRPASSSPVHGQVGDPQLSVEQPQ
jgi:pantoate kinase